VTRVQRATKYSGRLRWLSQVKDLPLYFRQ
jgi:hypothetical protein